jgi:hypothetical protein
MEKFDVYLIISLLIFFGISLTVINYILYKKIFNYNKNYKLFVEEIEKKIILNEDNFRYMVDDLRGEIHTISKDIEVSNFNTEQKLVSDLEKMFTEKIKDPS